MIRAPATAVITAVIAVAALALALPACGASKQEAVKKVVEGYFADLARGDYPGACGELSAAARRDLASYAAEQLPELGTIECAPVLRQVFSLADEGQLSALRRVRVSAVDIEGDAATAEVEGAPQSVPLRRIGGGWKIDHLDFSPS